MTLTLTDAEEARLAAAARAAGVAPDALLKAWLRSLPPLPSALPDRDAREAAIRAAYGSLAWVGATVEDLHAQRQADKVREEQVGEGS